MFQDVPQQDSIGPELCGHTGMDTVQVEGAVNNFTDRVNNQLSVMWRRWSNILLTAWTYCCANLMSLDHERQHSKAVHSHWRWGGEGCRMDTQVTARDTPTCAQTVLMHKSVAISFSCCNTFTGKHPQLRLVVMPYQY